MEYSAIKYRNVKYCFPWIYYKIKFYEWYKRFQDGCEDIEDKECTSHPGISTTDENVKKSGRNDHERSPNYN